MPSFLGEQKDYLLFICGVCYFGIGVMSFYYGSMQERIKRWLWLGAFGTLQAFAWWSFEAVLVLHQPQPLVRAASIAMALSCFALAEFTANTLSIYLSRFDKRFLWSALCRVLLYGVAGLWSMTLFKTPWIRIVSEKASFVPILLYLVVGFGLCLLGIWERNLIEIDNDRKYRQGLVDVERARYSNRVTWIAVVLVVGGWFVTQSAGQVGETAARRQLILRSRTTAAALDYYNIAQLSGKPEDVAKPEYRSVLNSLQRILKSNPDTRYAYLMKRDKNGKVFFLADGEPANSQWYSPPGSEYDSVSKKLASVFEGRRKYVVDGPITDSWGSWVSGHAIIPDPVTGKPVAVFGMDISVDDWQKMVELHRLAAIVITVIVIICVVAISIIVRIWMERIADADFISKRYDTLTGLANRTLLAEYLEEAIKVAPLNKNKVAVVLLDLDQFKRINDTLGHDIGDKLLQYVARLLEHWAGENDLIARLGGDEFAAVLTRRRAGQVIGMVGRLNELFRESITIEGNQLYITPSMGISIYPTDGGGEDLLKNAETAMYQAKEQGRNRYRFYTMEMNSRAQKRFSIENSLISAIDNDEFVLHYQPQLDLRTSAITGVEVLVRWEHPEFGLLLPGSFIPIAEEVGLIDKIGEIVFRKACYQLKEWYNDGFTGLKLAVNLSGAQFKHDLTEIVESILFETGIDPRYLEVEITETSAVKDLDLTAGILNKLRKLGISIALDDFGTGYSSLIYLRRLPLQTVKIDRTFVIDISTNPDAAAIISAVITMAHTLNMSVLAEGVENEEQLSYLKMHGCDAAQGYIISKPLPAEEYRRVFLASSQNRIEKSLA